MSVISQSHLCCLPLSNGVVSISPSILVVFRVAGNQPNESFKLLYADRKRPSFVPTYYAIVTVATEL